MMKLAAVTTTPLRDAKLQSNHHHQCINMQRLYRQLPFLLANQQCQSNESIIQNKKGYKLPLIHCLSHLSHHLHSSHVFYVVFFFHSFTPSLKLISSPSHIPIRLHSQLLSKYITLNVSFSVFSVNFSVWFCAVE